MNAGYAKRRTLRSRRTRAIRLLLGGGLSLLAVGQLLSFPTVTDWGDTILTAGVGKVAYNISTAAGLFLLLCFFIRATGGRSNRISGTAWHAVAFMVAAGLMVGLMAATPHEFRHHSLQSPFVTVPQVAFFYIAGNAYFIYAYIACGWNVWTYQADKVNRVTPLMKASLRVIAAAAAGLTLTSIGRAGWVLTKFTRGVAPEWFDWTNWQIANISFLLLAAGLSLLVVADTATAFRRYRARIGQYRELALLWSELTRAYPAVVMRGWWRLRGRFHRRVIECIDGLARLRPHIAAVAGDVDLIQCDASDLAGYVWAALERKQALLDHTVPAGVTADLLILSEQDPAAVVTQLLALAAEFRDQRAQAQPA